MLSGKDGEVEQTRSVIIIIDNDSYDSEGLSMTIIPLALSQPLSQVKRCVTVTQSTFLFSAVPDITQ